MSIPRRILSLAVTTAVGGLLLSASGSAQAGIIITRSTVREVADPTFLYTFDVAIDDECTLSAGNYFTLFDLFSDDPANFVVDESHPDDWVFADPPPLLGPSPGGVPDSSSAYNISWSYFGPQISGPTFLGTFTVTIDQQEANPTTLAWFASVCGTGRTVDIVRTEIAISAVPEPTTLLSGLLGAVGLLGWHVRRSRTRPAAA